MVNYEDDLKEERALNELLKIKLRQSDARLQTLEALAKEGSDPFRDLLRKELGMPPREAASGRVAVPYIPPRAPGALPGPLMKIIRLIGKRDVNFTELSEFITKNAEWTGKDPRRVMFDYKNKYEVFDNFSKGHYRLNERGLLAYKNDEL